MLKNTAWTIFIAIFLSLLSYFLFSPKIQYGGDIIEYFGTSESLINHQGLNLMEQDKTNLVKRLGSGYFDNPEYYLQAKNGQRYAVHFPLYSLINVPTRIALRILGIDEYKAFRLTNLLILTLVSFIILKFYLKSFFSQIAYLVLVYLSPIIWHLVWPGPEVFSLSLTLLSIFLFLDHNPKRRTWAILLSTVASYQSQPLVVVPVIYLITYFIESYRKTKKLVTSWKEAFLYLVLLLLIFLPNIYYFLIFGSFSSFSKLSGVAFANFTFKKFFELFFDPNIGLFWYAPIIFITGFYFLIKSAIKEKNTIFLEIILLTSTFYLVNINWNNGTAGFGPTRYALPVLPFLIYFYCKNAVFNIKHVLILFLIGITQLGILSFNGYIMPDFENTVRHSPYAQLVLNNFPSLYNPTPEIFVERTRELEGGFWDTTIYKDKGNCRKAYVLITGTQKLIDECGFIPEKYKSELVNEFLEKTNSPRTVVTTEATFYPADGVCSWDYKQDESYPYVCMRNIEDVVRYTGIKDEGRFVGIDNMPGIWKMKWGQPADITVPAGYIINHYSLKGIYVDY
ncbi:hypothetical protein MUP32_05680 [Candidatus Microgenomates bacterium]|nr:hypothetical protein [Candidatus Microgenomates bacterium]